MNRLTALPVIVCLALPLSAAAEEEDGFSLMDEGARLILRGLMTEMEPALDDLGAFALEAQPKLREFVETLGPALLDVLGKIDEITNYEAPEILDNGDILLRRSPDAPPWVPADPVAPLEEIDL